MKTVYLFLLLSAASLIVMVIVDVVLGSKAELLNAYSVLQRLLGQAPTAGDSLVARKLGAVGEFAVVIVVNFIIGGILTAMVRFFTSR
jgi:hypothetical protein